MNTLTAKHEAFALALADPSCKGPTEAYRRAGYTVADPATKAQMTAASELGARPEIVRRVTELRNAVASAAVMTAAQVLNEWKLIALADPAELSRVRRWCCRHCYGVNFRYQWISDEEFALAAARAIDYNATKSPRAASQAMPSFDGGVGYDRNLPPNALCPYCGGDGEFDTYFEDTMRLSPAARRLYAGVKQTRDGMEIKTRDQGEALKNIAAYLGMLVERHAHGGDPLNPTPITTLSGDITAAEAAKLYAATMGAK